MLFPTMLVLPALIVVLLESGALMIKSVVGVLCGRVPLAWDRDTKDRNPNNPIFQALWPGSSEDADAASARSRWRTVPRLPTPDAKTVRG